MNVDSYRVDVIYVEVDPPGIN